MLPIKLVDAFFTDIIVQLFVWVVIDRIRINRYRMDFIFDNGIILCWKCGL